ncbi:unnamed protein product, partial [Pleuronectes platessa]
TAEDHQSPIPKREESTSSEFNEERSTVQSMGLITIPAEGGSPVPSQGGSPVINRENHHQISRGSELITVHHRGYQSINQGSITSSERSSDTQLITGRSSIEVHH